MVNNRGQIAASIGAILGLLVLIAVIAWVGWFRTVDQGETCVVVKLGKVSHVAPTGVSWSFRGTNRYICYDSRMVMYQLATDAQGNADYMDWPVTANTSDGQKVTITANVSFHVNPEQVIVVYGTQGRKMEEVKERVVANFTRSVLRNLAPFYQAEDLYTKGRLDYESAVEDELRILFSERGVTLDSFRLRSITFDPDYVQAIENQQIAQENIETKQYESEQAVYEAVRAAELAKGTADARIEQARGEAEAVRIAASAEAAAIMLRGEALRLFPEVLQLNFINELSDAKWLMLPNTGITQFLPLDVLGLDSE